MTPEQMLEMLAEYSEHDLNDEAMCYFSWSISPDANGVPVIQVVHTDASEDDGAKTVRRWKMVELT
jgi:hypothetical protein